MRQLRVAGRDLLLLQPLPRLGSVPGLASYGRGRGERKHSCQILLKGVCIGCTVLSRIFTVQCVNRNVALRDTPWLARATVQDRGSTYKVPETPSSREELFYPTQRPTLKSIANTSWANQNNV